MPLLYIRTHIYKREQALPLAPGNKKAEVILQSLPLFKASNRIELFHSGFADHPLPIWVRRRIAVNITNK